ncbi:MAG: Coenzyme A biosynthesis bifunctional protein CoaBC, partial [Alphaproteobacteria bacterium MarineAlpha10_Bin3]
GPPVLEFTENPDILKTLAAAGCGRLVVGFAAETQHIVENARKKRLAKNCDWMLANDVSPGTGTFGGDANTIHLIDAASEESWPAMTKQQVAERLVARIAEFFEDKA